MSAINLDKKVFRLLENSENGAVSGATSFHYSQDGDTVTAIYKRGGVLDGQIIAIWRSDHLLEMRYHCIMNDQTFKAGKADARVTKNSDGLLELHLDWQWLGDKPDKGQSVYIEVR